MGDKCKLILPKARRVGDKWGQVGDKCKLIQPKAPELETSEGDKWKLMRPKARRAGDKCGRQVLEESGRQV